LHGGRARFVNRLFGSLVRTVGRRGRLVLFCWWRPKNANLREPINDAAKSSDDAAECGHPCRQIWFLNVGIKLGSCPTTMSMIDTVAELNVAIKLGSSPTVENKSDIGFINWACVAFKASRERWYQTGVVRNY